MTIRPERQLQLILHVHHPTRTSCESEDGSWRISSIHISKSTLTLRAWGRVCPSVYILQCRKDECTHPFLFSHHDHTGGNLALKKLYTGVKIIGPLREERKIPGIDTSVTGGDCFEFGQSKVEIMDVGGHTLGHIAYYFPEHQKVFCGDALFALGCGRMFEGTPDQFWESLTSLRELPDDTVVYW